jgi:spermidine/putrescine transport system substrate-binding protein
MTDPMQDPTNPQFTRRHALGLAAVGAVALAGLNGCGGDSGGSSSTATTGGAAASPDSFKGETLNVFTWSGYHDKKWIAEYEKLRGVTVNTQLFGSVPDGFAKVRANPDGFDLVLATSGWVENYADAGIIVPIDETKIPNMKNITPQLKWRDATEYKGKNYAVIYNWGDEPLCWIPGKVATPSSWRALYDPQYKGKVSLVDDPTTVMPFIPIMLGFPNPYKLTDAQFAQMKKALMDLRGQVTHVSASIDDQTSDFGNGQVTLGVLYNIGTQVKLREDGITLKQVIPKEGAAAWSDNYVLTKAGDKKAALAYDFMNYTLTVPWQARFAAETSNTGILTLEEATSPAAVKAGLTKKALATTLLPYTAAGPAFFEKIKLLQRVPNVEQWLEAWNEFKTGL